MLHYSDTGIGRYLRHLYQAVAGLHAGAVPGALAPPGETITVLYSRRDSRQSLRRALPRGAISFTPAHHRMERWALALEGARLRPTLWHAPDHVCPQPMGWRTVVTVHDLAFLRYPESHTPASRAYYAALGRSVRQATRVICISEATRRDLLSATAVAEEKVRVVHEAPDPRFAAPAPAGRPLTDLSETGRPYFVCVGTIQPRKNLALVFQALARLAPAERPELRVVGAPGWGGAEIAALPAQLGVAGDVRFLGRRSTAEVVALYRDALALIYPSLLEGFGLPVLEAMAAGAPVVASDRSSIPEVAGDAALLFDAQDATALATLLERVAASPRLREDLRARGRVRATHFSWERAARATLEVFDEALKA